jgi:flagellar biosynthetic protein FlhB
MPDSSAERTEPPTARRLQESREQGQVAKSQDLTAAITLFGAVVLMGMLGGRILTSFRLIVASSLGGEWLDDPARPVSVVKVLGNTGLIGLRAALPVVLGLFALGVIANVLQVGFLLTPKPLVPNLGKISPLRGLQNLFSLRSLMRLAMSLGKVFVVLAVAALSIYLDLPKILGLAHLDAGPMIIAAGKLVYWLSVKIAAVLILLAIIDYAYQKWQFHQDQKMTKEEVKEEFKRMEGDPLIKQRRAKVARQLAMQRMGQAVPTADVVVTNPTHFAVALKYDDSMVAPKVVAKGADIMAMRIRQLAIANGVPIVERPPLARALYRYVEVGQEIPEKFYSAVAEILAYVYRISGKSTAAATG